MAYIKYLLLGGALFLFELVNISSASYFYNNNEYDLTSLLIWSEAEAEAVAWGASRYY